METLEYKDKALEVYRKEYKRLRTSLFYYSESLKSICQKHGYDFEKISEGIRYAVQDIHGREVNQPVS